MNAERLALLTILNQLEVARGQLCDSIDGYRWMDGWARKIPLSQREREDKAKEAYKIISSILNDAANR